MIPFVQKLRQPLVWSVLCLLILGVIRWELTPISRLEASVEDSRNSNAEDQINEREFSGKRAFVYLEKQCEFGARFPGSAAHQKTQAYLLAELEKFAEEAVLQPFEYRQQNQSIKMNNILARFGGNGGGTMLLAAHWDTRPFADLDPNLANRNTPILGANDGASGVAVLLEVARILKSNPPATPVIIVLFDGEDYGKTVSDMFLGSRYFAQNMGRWSADFGILLDMVGDRDLELPMERYSWNADRQLTEAVWRRAEEIGLPEFQRRLGAAVMDDHLQLIEAGVPTVNIIDFTYPYWHTIEDTPDKCSPHSLEVVGRLVLDIVYRGL